MTANVKWSCRYKTAFNMLQFDVSIKSLAAQGAEICRFFKRHQTWNTLYRVQGHCPASNHKTVRVYSVHCTAGQRFCWPLLFLIACANQSQWYVQAHQWTLQTMLTVSLFDSQDWQKQTRNRVTRAETRHTTKASATDETKRRSKEAK